MRFGWSGLAVLLLLVSGCAGAGTKVQVSSVATTTASAPAPTVDAETGSVTGLVVDDEALPIVGADVGNLQTKLSVKTDAGGAFTMNQLQPGSYSLVAGALGYESVAKKVEVRPGKVTHVNFTLIAIAVAQEAYYRPMLRTAFLNVDQMWYATVATSAGQNHSAICGTCIFTLNVDKGAVQVMSEHSYQQTGVPGYNDGMHLNYRVGTVFDNWGFCWREQRLWPESTQKAVAASGKAVIEVGSHFVAVSVQHRIDAWNTFSYMSELPENFTALPPTAEVRQNPTVCTIK